MSKQEAMQAVSYLYEAQLLGARAMLDAYTILVWTIEQELKEKGAKS